MGEAESQSSDEIGTPPEIDDATSKRIEMTASQAIELLKAGKVVENARIKKLRFIGTIEYEVRFRNCLLVQMEFRAATFNKPVAFLASTVDRAQFNKRIKFEADLRVDGSVINRTIFGGMEVQGSFSSSTTHYRGQAGFKNCVFNGNANFWEAKFHSWIDFDNCQFHGVADFRSIHADQGFVASGGSIFKGECLFRGAHVQKKFQLDGSRFEQSLDLAKAKLHDFCYLETIVQGPQQTFSFLNTVAERIRIQPQQIENRLESERKGKHEDAMQEYGLLKKCYSALHRFDQEDWAFYRFKVAQRKSKPMIWKRPWTVWRTFGDWLFLDIGCGYGTNPLRAVRMAVVIILSFALLYGLNIDLFYVEKVPFPEYAKDELINRIMVGLTTSVSIFTSGMGGIREIAKSWMNIPVMIESIMGTLLFGLFIVAFSRKVIR